MHDTIINRVCRLLTNEASSSNCIAIDTTFNLVSNCFVTSCVVKNTDMIGNPGLPFATMIHDRRIQAVHADFLRFVFAPLKAHLRKKKTRTIITLDREKAISNGANEVIEEYDLQDAVKLVFCENHILRNVDFFISSHNKRHPTDQINANLCKEEIRAFLVSNDEADLRRAVEEARTNWHDKYLKYFDRCLLDDLINNVNNKLDQQAYMTNNLSESFNHQIKVFVNEVNLPADSFILRYFQLICFLCGEFDLAYRGERGKFSLKDTSSNDRKQLCFGLKRFKLDLDDLESDGEVFSYRPKETFQRNFSQIYLAVTAINQGLIGFDTSNFVFTVANPIDRNNVHSVKFVKSKIICSCNFGRVCFHVHAINLIQRKETKVGDWDLDYGKLNKKRLPILRRAGKKGPEEVESRRKVRSNNVQRQNPKLKKLSKRKSCRIYYVGSKRSNCSKVNRRSFTPAEKPFKQRDQHLMSSIEPEPVDPETTVASKKQTSRGMKRSATEVNPEIVDLRASISNEKSAKKGRFASSVEQPAETSIEANCKQIMRPSEWLSDLHIQLFFSRAIIPRRQHILFVDLEFSRAISHLASWIRLNYDDQDSVLMPINESGNHWLLAAISLRKSKVIIFDSNSSSSDKVIQSVFNKALFLAHCLLILRGKRPNLRSFRLQVPSDSPAQNNGSDCGPMVCLVGLQILNRDFNGRIPAKSSERRTAVCEIIRSELQEEPCPAKYVEADVNYNSTTIEAIQSSFQIDRQVYRDLNYLECIKLLN